MPDNALFNFNAISQGGELSSLPETLRLSLHGESGLSSLWHGLNEKQPVQGSRLSTSSTPVTNAGKEYVSKAVKP